VRSEEFFEFRRLSQNQLGENELGALYEIRHSVTENRLGSIVIPRDEVIRRCCEGGAWICLDDGRAVAFSIASMHPVAMPWALFVRPSHEGRGIGQQLMAYSMDWFREQKASVVTLSTDPETRADRFYQRQGWTRGGVNAAGEVAFTFDFCQETARNSLDV
jgi:GNAT superfamily N-acetyltransferase